MRILRPLLLALLLSPLAACYDLYTRPAGAPDEPTDLPSRPREDGGGDMQESSLPVRLGSYIPSPVADFFVALSPDNRCLITLTSTDSSKLLSIKCQYYNKAQDAYDTICKFGESSLTLPVATATTSGFLVNFLPNNYLLVATVASDATLYTKYNLELYSISSAAKLEKVKLKNPVNVVATAGYEIRALRLSPDNKHVVYEASGKLHGNNEWVILQVPVPQPDTSTP